MKRMNHNNNSKDENENQPSTIRLDTTISTTNNVHTSLSIPLSSSTTTSRTTIPYLPNDDNFVRSAGPGCHIAFRYLSNTKDIDNIINNNNILTNDTTNGNDSTLTTTAMNNNTVINDWVLGWKPINDDDDDDGYEDDTHDEYEDDDDDNNHDDDVVDDVDNDTELPELMIDPEDFTLALYNRYKDEYQIAYISIYDCIVYGRNHNILSSSTTTTINNTDGESHDVIERTCTTLIVLCPPYTICILCYLPPLPSSSSSSQQQDQDHNDLSFYEQRIDSDIQIWKPHPNIHDFHSRSISFPLFTTRTTTTSSSDSNNIDDTIKNDDTTTTTIMKSPSESFLCTQGIGGSLTHFLYGNYHAIDFACTIGTPIIAVGDGIIINVKVDSSHITGIAVTNLFHWNSILLQLDNENNNNNHNTFDNESAETNQLPSSDNDTLFIEYVHIATSNVSVGQRVVEGEVIGTTGSVGFSPEPHLHISGYRNSDPITPTCGIYFHTKHEDKNLRTKFLPIAGQRYNEYGLVTTS